MEAGRSKGGLYRDILMITTIPLFVFAIVIVASSSSRFSGAMYQEVRNGLQSMGTTAVMIYDTLYPGDYELITEDTDSGSGLSVMKGERRINDDYAILDSLKERTGLEFTLFYSDTRIVTTIRNEDGARIIATGANAMVLEDVLYTGQAHFYPEVEVGGQSYFAYYMPLTNADGTCVGMMFVGKPSAQVNQYVRNSLLPIFGLALAGMVVTGLFSASYANKMIITLKKLKAFLGKVEQGNLSAELDDAVLRRNDEVGEMGHHAVNMQKELRELVERDVLTQMYNRRFGERRLKQIQQKSRDTGQAFAVALGDIDFFKKVNDTYGHECGDQVLFNVALLLKKHIAGSGFAARWGGEEFIVVYEKDTLETALDKTEDFMEELRGFKIRYGESELGVTMTFGIVAGDSHNYDQMIREADRLLYEGKQGGRNRVMTGRKPEVTE